MKARFYKYQGTGNDFVILNNMDGHITGLSQDKVALICHRRFGVGADGLILLEHADGYDFRMVYYNSDGNLGSMCGNGGRCLVKFAHDLKVISSHTSFIASDGPHLAHIQDGIVHLEMKNVYEIERNEAFFFMNTGSPHYVEIRENVKDLDVASQGRSIRYNERFKKDGTNVNFVELLPNNKLFARTYERGVEDETYSCGTGVTACAISASFHHYQSPITVDVLGGTLQVSFDKKSDGGFENVFLIGPAERVFEGQLEI